MSTLIHPPKKYTQLSSNINPQQQIKFSDPNDTLVKMLNYDNGSALKDFKAILDSMKQQFLQQKEKLPLFYQQNFVDLVDDLNLGNVSLNHAFSQKRINMINQKLKKVKNNKKPEIFSKYENLMKYSLRQNQKMNFIKQTSKRTDFMCLKSINNTSNSINKQKSKPNSKIFQSSNRKPLFPNSMQSKLHIFMQNKKQDMTIQASSKLTAQQKQITQMMKNRQICQKILEEALMFQRYYNQLKKQQIQRQQENQLSYRNSTFYSHGRSKTEISDKQGTKKDDKRQGRRLLSRRSQSKNSVSKYSIKNNNLCANPKHLRLEEQLQQKSNNYPKSQEQYYKCKYIKNLKKGQYYKRMNNINQEFVDKKNQKNNILITNLLGFIRTNMLINDKDQQHYDDGNTKGQSMNKNQSNIYNTNKSTKNKRQNKINKLSGCYITRILKKLFLIYSYTQSQQIGNKYQVVLQQQNIKNFINDFQIDIQRLAKLNDKIKELTTKQIIDQFQFIQLIHLLSLSYDQLSQKTIFNKDNQQNQGVIYTNINKFIGQKLLNQKYRSLLNIKQEKLLKEDLNKTFMNLRKLHRFKFKIKQVVNIFVEQQNINKLKTQTMFQDFQNVLQILWYIKIYPFHINKKKLRFYFDYLKQQSDNFLIKDTEITKQELSYLKIQNILWFIIAKISLQYQQETKHQQNEIVKTQNNIEKTFISQFKIILKLLNYIILENNKHKNKVY